MKPLDELLDLLELETLELNLFRGLSPDEDQQRVFGGQVAAQALVAAGRTVERDRPVHSLHAYFLRPGDPTVPIVYEVDRIRDGHSFTTRRVVAIQHGKAIFNLQASFQIVEDGPDHAMEMPKVPLPEELPTYRERLEPYLPRLGPDMVDWLVRERPIDSRPSTIRTGWSPHRARRRKTCGSRPTAGCPTTSSCTPASSRTPRISRCSIPRRCRTRLDTTGAT